MHLLDYVKWENFAKVIKRAMIACENSGHSIPDDFPEVRKIVAAGAATKPKKIMSCQSFFNKYAVTKCVNRI